MSDVDLTALVQISCLRDAVTAACTHIIVMQSRDTCLVSSFSRIGLGSVSILVRLVEALAVSSFNVSSRLMTVS